MIWRELIERLTREGLIQAQAAADLETLSERDGPPWYVRLLLGLGAWMAAIFAIIFLAVLDVLDSEAAFLTFGGMLGMAATLTRRAIKDSARDFFAQLALAAALASQVLMGIGLAEWLGETELWGPALLAYQALLIRFFPDRTGRFITMMAMQGVVVVMADDIPYLGEAAVLGQAAAAGWLWLRAPRLLAGRLGAAQPPLAFGTVMGVFVLLCFGLAEAMPIGFPTQLGLTLGVAWLAWSIAPGRSPWAAIAPLVLGFTSSGVIAAVGALVLGFYRRSRLLEGIAWAALLLFGGAFYYQLHLTLMVKSQLMMLSGALLLFVRWRLR